MPQVKGEWLGCILEMVNWRTDASFSRYRYDGLYRVEKVAPKTL
jgi:hypothetical protein